MLRVLLFIKYPEAGRVKTRLASSFGDKGAVAIYRRMVEEQVQQVPSQAELQVHFHPAARLDDFKSWLGDDIDYRAQIDGDLGQRLAHGAEIAFHEGSNPVVLIGGDCPDLDAEVLHTAEERLQAHDVVIGPAGDGGYYLLGMRDFQAELFQDIEWSSNKVLGQTLKKLVVAGLSFDLLEILDDVDDEARLRKVRPEWVNSSSNFGSALES